MQMSKVRIWILGFLLVLYLVGVLLLSAVTLHEPRDSLRSQKVKEHKNQATSKSLEYGLSGLRPPRRFRIEWCSNLQFHNPPKEPVALASFPGSGNTWLRYLLQQATGIYTGSVYKDYGLLKSGFPAESISNGSVLVVKTHEWGADTRRAFAKAILLVRSPGPAIQAEFNRQSGGHIGFASPDRYKKTRGRYWQQFVFDKLEAWKQMNLDWLYNFTGPTHVVFYEQLVDNVQHTLTVLLEFLEVPASERQLACALERQEGIYRRKKKPLDFDPYTSAMKQRLQAEQQKMFKAQGFDQQFNQNTSLEGPSGDSSNFNDMQQRMNEQNGAGDNNDNQSARTKLIINYIPQFATEEELAKIFSQVGQIENIRIMRDFRTGYSYGFGFVKYTKPEAAAKAIESFNGMNFRNKRLKVSYSRPPGHDMKDSNLYITNLPKTVSEEDIEKMFGEFGEIIQRTILKDKITGMPRGVAFVRYAKTHEAQAAIAALDGKLLDNAMLPLSIRVAEDHGRQKAHYLDYMNHLCLFNGRGFGPFRGGTIAPFRDLHVPRGNFTVRGGCCPFMSSHLNRYMGGMGAGDNFHQNQVFW